MRHAVLCPLAIHAQPGAVSSKGERNAAGTLGGKRAGNVRGGVLVGGAKTQQFQVFIAGLDPVGQGRDLLHGGHVGTQIGSQLGAQIHVHADGPALGLGALQHGEHLVVFGRHQHQRAGVQHAGRLLRQDLQDFVHAVVAVGNAFAVKAVAGLAVFDLHHRQRGGQAAAAQHHVHFVFGQLGLHLHAKLVLRKAVQKGYLSAAQRSGPRQVEGAAAHMGTQQAIGGGDAVHQSFAEYVNRGHGAECQKAI